MNVFILFRSYCVFLAEIEDKKVLIVATIAWVLHKCSRAFTLVLIFVIAMKPGFIHALYSMSK